MQLAANDSAVTPWGLTWVLSGFAAEINQLCKGL